MRKRNKENETSQGNKNALASSVLSLLNHLPVAIYRGLKDWSITIMSAEVEQITGFTSSDFTSGRVAWKELIHPDDLGRVKESFRKSVSKGTGFLRTEYRFRHKDGSYRWFEDRRHMIYDSGGSFAYVDGLILDITERKRAEEALRSSEERYRLIVDTMNEGLALADRDYVFTFVNNRLSEMLGYSRDEIVGNPLIEFVHEDDQDLMKEQIKMRKKGLAERFEMAWRAKDGRKIYTLASPRAIMDGEGNFMGSIGVLTDITKRKKVEQELLESEKRFREVVDNIREVFWLFDWVEQKVIYVSPAYEAIWGRRVQDLYDRYEEWGESIYPDDLAHAEETFKRILETGGGEPREYRIVRPDGEMRWISDRGFAIRNQDGQVVRITGIAEDITERKLAEKALRESEEKFRSVVEESLVGVYIIQDNIFQYVNSKFCHIFGYTHDELMGKLGPNDLAHHEDRHIVQENIRQRLSREAESIEYEFRGVRKSGEVFPVKVLGRRSIYHGHPAIKGTLIDLTKEKELEHRYLHSQKMEAIGRLAGGIAHDINNYLGAITGFAELVKMTNDGDTLLSQKMDDITHSAFSASTLIDQLLAFSKRQTARPKVVNLNNNIQSMKKMAERLIGEDIHFSVRLADNLHNVEIDPSQVEQILVNLLINSREAMPRGGDISLETANVEFHDDGAIGHPEVLTGTYVELSVSDTGTGIPDEIREKVFEPFFTTKDKSKSSGLGLATVFGVVQQNGGFIRLHSESGKGTSMKIYLPICTKELVPSIGKPAKETTDLKGSEKILFVEDNEDVRKSTMDLLNSMGYQVIAASNGNEALSLFEEEADNIDLIITDVVMPGMSGKELVDQVHEVNSSVAVLFISGYDDDMIGHHGILREKLNFLQKPYSSRALAGKIKEILLTL